MTPTSIALNRFGLGYRQGDELPRDPKAWLRGQIAAYNPWSGELAQEDYAAEQLTSLVSNVDEFRSRRRNIGKTGAADAGKQQVEMSREGRREVKTIYTADVAVRTRVAVESDTPFMERLVHFWSNHFAVSTGKKRITNLVGIYEFGAIRPNITGNFRDLLRAASLHPAMLFYLDQFSSTGPASAAMTRSGAQQGGRGLNENLGREILELHTLGVNGGYSQADVLELAKALTGWTVQGIQQAARAAPQHNGSAFFSAIHEPGTRTIAGRSYREDGAGQALAILDDLALHPSTARHLATKLARHFAGDVPPPAMVARLEQAYNDSGGDLPTVYRAIIDSPEAWAPEPVKVRQPFEWVVGMLRAAGDQVVKDWWLARILSELGQETWAPTSPAGWDDRADSWMGPDALFRRVEAAEAIAEKTRLSDVRELADAMFPGALSSTTQASIDAAESNQMALALLMVSPEMLRR
ncbi:DUF1800 domain-containing protein [Qipengyuania marisflavi]|uniref:DUF1800 domain-containing protein n=1 Tax=Qipengyuania marisflavi TaxID=2486356 RepID=A0A5S3P783_9SPHN|nr:DUF1800 domain-containing protein [Qipengyuania marisflavi]TMM49005.1 DUF1800 domain-containing protein [Qipengyuania marisflavi]